MNDLAESRKSKQKRPTMRFYQPRSTNAVKRSDSTNGGSNGNGNSSNSDDNTNNSKPNSDPHLEDRDLSAYDSKSREDSAANDRKKPNSTKLRDQSYEDSLVDSFNKKATLNDKPRNSQASASQNSNQQTNDDEFSNMLEIYDLSPDLKSQDIRSSLYHLPTGEYEIRWVNDCRAILVFSTKSIANEALKKSTLTNLKLRKLSQGSAESKEKARQCTDNLPLKQRPETSAFLARRLVSGALGIRVPLTKEKRDAERKKIQDARDRKQERERQLKSAWEG